MLTTEYHASTQWMEAPCPTSLKKTETWKPVHHFRERIKGCFFRCPCTPNPSARHCSLSLLNTYTAEVPRDLKQARTSACKVQNWCINTWQPLPHHIFQFQVFVFPLAQLFEQPRQGKETQSHCKKPTPVPPPMYESAIQHTTKTEVALPLVRILHIKI